MPKDMLRLPWEVLVVDDDEGIRELIVSYFNALDISVTAAQDGRDAIATLQRSSGRYGMVVTDLNLPGADGFAVLQASKQANPECYVIIVTGYASLDSAIRAVRVGAYDYLTKPFSMGQLDVVLKRITDRIALDRGPSAPDPTPAAVPVARPASRPAGGPTALAASGIEAMLQRIEEKIDRLESSLRLPARVPLGR